MFIPNHRILILTTLMTYAGIAIAGVPVLSGLTNTTYTGGQGAIPVAGSANLSGGISYAEGNIRFNVSNAASNDLIALTSSPTPNALGAISLVSSDVYLGDGTGNTRIGSIDQIEDGTGGNPLKILFSTPLENSGFESGTTGWTIVSAEYGDSADEINLDGFTIDLANDGVYTGGTGTVNTVAASNMTFTGSIAVGQGVGGTAALSLTSSGNIVSEDQNPPGAGNPDGYGSIHGPYATSSVFTVVDGDSLSLEFKAVGSGDDYEVFGLIRRVDGSGNFIDNNWPTTNTAGNNVLLFAQRGNDTGGFVTITKAGLTAGSYRFQFVGGTYDYSGGYYVGSLLYVDDIRLVSATGVTDATVETIAQQVTFDSGCPLDTTTRNLDLSVLTQDANTTNATSTITINTDPNDVDNDCIPDVTEGTSDTDGDSIPDYQDPDTDNDGIPDVLEGSVDTDSDGTPDYRDLDSDDDGLFDLTESGIVNSAALDSNSDGIIDTALGTNGLADAVETSVDSGVLNYTLADSDSDGIPDFQETDADADGIPDADEGAIDSDGDGTPNFQDTDSDDDGIPDSTEGVTDTDGDGTPNYLDLDSDGDGSPDADELSAATDPYDDASIPDVDGDGINDPDEGSGDSDGDGIVNKWDIDSDNDGVLDSVEGNVDTDSDGVSDFLDLDRDNDGLPDIVESGLSNIATLDTNGDNRIDTSVGTNGLADAIETTSDSGTLNYTTADADGDGVVDGLDLDSDNDGLYDITESGISAPGTLDNNDDGMIDSGFGTNGLANAIETSTDNGVLNYTVTDTDSDNVYDFRDLDSDNDGIPDVEESGGTDPDHDAVVGSGAPVVDASGLTGTILAALDTDSDGTANFRDLDADGDGANDLIEGGGTDADANGIVDGFSDANGDGYDDTIAASPLPLPDSDSDGSPDYLDGVDADGDGISDQIDQDDDNDGIPDTLEGSGVVDTDGDGVADSVDLDSDNDGVFDLAESGAANTDILDSNDDGLIDLSYAVGANGIADVIETSAESGVVNYNSGIPVDTDGDGIADFRDRDSDNDGIADVVEAGHSDPDGDGVIGSGVPVVNVSGYAGGSSSDLVDSDGDSIPDLRDLDSDNDGLDDVLENGGTDTDRDAHLDTITDTNGDGFDDTIAAAGQGALDTDNDGIPDYRDSDSDNDGMSDLIESGGHDGNGDGVVDDFTDSDSDGRDDDLAMNPPTDLDRDNDGVLDFQSDASQEAPVETGTQGVGGCTIAENSSFDPVLLLLILISLGFVLSDYKRVCRIDHKE